MRISPKVAATVMAALALACGITFLVRSHAQTRTPARAEAASSAPLRATRTSPPAGAPVFPAGVSNRPSGAVPAFRLLIPRLGIDAGVESVGADGRGRIGVPTYIWDAAWFRDGPSPGEPGDAVIDGHLDWYTGPALFAHLAALRNGDTVSVIRAGTRLDFRVVALHWVPYTSKPSGLLEPAGPPRLTLITCGGSWNAAAGSYSERLLVETALA